jgi:di/tricarboxylate transporter
MTPEIAICLAIFAAAVVLFAWDRVPADVVALGVLLAVIGTGLLPRDKAFAGFASDTVLMILGLLIMSAGLVQTGVVEIVGRRIFDFAGRSAGIFLPVVTISVAVVSAFMSNTAATAVFVPLVVGYASKIGASPSKFLLPLAFSSILTSSVTLISTSTNLIVSDALTRYQQPPMGMFEMAPVGIPIAILGLVYILTIGVRLIPERGNQKAEEKIGERRYQAEVLVANDGPVVGKTLKDAGIAADGVIALVKVLRGGEILTGQRIASDFKLAAGDTLVMEGPRTDLLKIKDLDGLDFKADVHLADPENDPAETTIVEGVLMPRSPLIGQSLRRLGFKERYGLQVLALHRAGGSPASMSSVRLRLGDVLLLQGAQEDVRRLERGNLFNIFGGIEPERLNFTRAPIAASIFVLAIAAVTLDLVSLAVAALGGAFAMLLTRCLSPEQAYAQVEWKALILIGALLSLGAAMDATGTGKYLAQQLIAAIGGDGPYLLLSCFFLLTVALTQPMSNQAAALVVLPIAIQTGVQLGANPRAFAMMVAVAASCSYLTPLEPSCLMVYGPGKYQFFDFFKVGLPLTVLVYLLAILLVPAVWPL